MEIMIKIIQSMTEWQTEGEVQEESRERRSPFGFRKMRLLSLEISKCDKNSKYLIKNNKHAN